MNLLGGLLVGLGVLLIVPMLCVLLIIGAMPWLGVTPTSQTTVATSSIVRTIDVTPAPVTPVPTVVASASGTVLQALFEAARSWLGTPYLFGGCSRRGIDCSCLQQIAFAAIGVRLPRTTVEQIRVATPIAAADARPGDLVFFRQTCSNCGADPTHVGLVIDSGHNLMLDAGDPVKIESFDTPYWRGHYMATGRVL